MPLSPSPACATKDAEAGLIIACTMLIPTAKGEEHTHGKIVFRECHPVHLLLQLDCAVLLSLGERVPLRPPLQIGVIVVSDVLDMLRVLEGKIT